jgi:hypothetical protein
MEWEIMFLCNSLGVILVLMFSMLSIVGFQQERNCKVIKFEKE